MGFHELDLLVKPPIDFKSIQRQTPHWVATHGEQFAAGSTEVLEYVSLLGDETLAQARRGR